MTSQSPAANSLAQFTPFYDLRGATWRDFRKDVGAALAVTFLSVPQGVAYALIAGLPPAMGLYAAALPAIVGGLFRSSRHVVSGPTNALCLLVGLIVADFSGGNLVAIATTLAVMTGLIQLAAGVLRLGSLSEYISSPVVAGYITGAGILIGIGQLNNATGSPGAQGNVYEQITGWLAHLDQTHPLALTLTVVTVLLLVVLRHKAPQTPGAVIVTGIGIAASWFFGLSNYGIVTVADIVPIPTGLPHLQRPIGRPSHN